MGTCQVVYNSIMLAMNRQEVIADFARLFKLSPEKAAAILAQPKTVLRSKLDADTAERYREQLLAIGLDVDVVDTALLKPVPASALELVAATELPTAIPLALEPLPVVASSEVHNAELRRGNRSLSFEFDGSGSGFFRIWIVNVLLSLLTLGIYSAWARVRTQQYFYSNTRLDDVCFHYLATPVQVMRARAFGLALLLLYFGAQWYSMQAGLLALIVLLCACPFLLVLGMSARLGFAAWRNVRFAFERDFAAAGKLLLLPLLSGAILLTAEQYPETLGMPDATAAVLMGVALLLSGLLLPYWLFAITRFLVEHTRYGSGFLVFAAKPLQYYLLFYVKTPLVFIGAMVLTGIAAALIGADEVRAAFHALGTVSLDDNLADLLDMLPAYLLPLTVGLLVVGACMVAAACVQAGQFNLRYHGMSLGKSVLVCRMQATHLLGLWLLHALLIVLTGGLSIPWAKVSVVRYRLSCLTLHASYDLDDIVHESRQIGLG